jgi:HEAT repeat protein
MGIFKPNVERLKEKKDVNGLVKALHHKKSHIRAHAAYALGEIRAHDAVKPLIDALLTDNLDVRREAARSLGILKDHRASGALIEIFKYGLFFNRDSQTITDAYGNERKPNYSIGDSFVEVHENARWALGEIGKPAVNSLLSTLSDDSPFARAFAANTLGVIKDRRAIEPLCKLLKDSNSFVREAAAWSLGELGEEGSLEPLTKAMKDEDDKVRYVAKEALKKIKK